MMALLPWVAEAMTCLGVGEIPGVRTSPAIARWLRQLDAWWDNDETPWCGVFTAHCFQVSGVPVPKRWMTARAWADWGVPLVLPVVGCVVVFERGAGGHVGIVVGKTRGGLLMVLGGNQGDKVCIAPFPRGRVLAYRWPTGCRIDERELPVLETAAQPSRNES